MRISALLPARNGARTLAAALESLHLQTRPVDTCVVVDDGSTDSTPRLLAEWQARWRALRVVRTPGVGIAAALNLGLAKCDGSEWIARLDADDMAHPERLARQLETAAETGAALVGCEVRHWLASPECAARFEGMRRHIDWANAQRTHDELERALWIDSPLPHPSWLVHRRAFELAGAYDESGRLPEDYDWLHRFFAAAREGTGLRAVKAPGGALVDWAESEGRLTRTSAAYGESAFNEVKARALAKLLRGRSPELCVFGLGPKAKALVPLLAGHGCAPRAIVEVHPRRVGIRYQGIPVCDVEEWRQAVPRARDPFVLVCLGTPSTRENGERLCREAGLSPLRQFVSL